MNESWLNEQALPSLAGWSSLFNKKTAVSKTLTHVYFLQQQQVFIYFSLIPHQSHGHSAMHHKDLPSIYFDSHWANYSVYCQNADRNIFLHRIFFYNIHTSSHLKSKWPLCCSWSLNMSLSGWSLHLVKISYFFFFSTKGIRYSSITFHTTLLLSLEINNSFWILVEAGNFFL